MPEARDGNTEPRLPYEPPLVEVVGTLQALTLGNNGLAVDGTSLNPKAGLVLAPSG